MEYISCIYLFLCPRTHIHTSNLSHLSVDMRAYSYAEAFMDWETIYRHVQPSMLGRGAYLLVFQLFSLRLGLNTCEPYGGPCIVPSSACIWLTLVLQSHGSTLSVTVFCEKYKKWKKNGKIMLQILPWNNMFCRFWCCALFAGISQYYTRILFARSFEQYNEVARAKHKHSFPFPHLSFYR